MTTDPELVALCEAVIRKFWMAYGQRPASLDDEIVGVEHEAGFVADALDGKVVMRSHRKCPECDGIMLTKQELANGVANTDTLEELLAAEARIAELEAQVRKLSVYGRMR